MSIKFDAEDKSLSDIFTGQEKYKIPRYQRPYSWTTDEVSDLWNDLKEEDSILKLAEEFLKSLPLDPKTLSEERLYIFHEFKKRREILKEDLTKDVEINLSQLGEELSKENLKINLIETLTSDMLRTGSYKNKRFRRYDVKINVPKIYSGRRHFVNQAIDYSKRIWLDLGFKEMEGNIINTSFWNFDALFTPQDHPA
ncbi:MAG: Phenylalanine-tRNA ligase alpha subunit, partial [Candidatus Azambacteria bacterium GW2011_GWF1_41_10]